jgi:hypothetical protein
MRNCSTAHIGGNLCCPAEMQLCGMICAAQKVQSAITNYALRIIKGDYLYAVDRT